MKGNFIVDGEFVSLKLINKFQLDNLTQKTKAGHRADFVGLILHQEEFLISFPKHFILSEQKVSNNDIQLLLNVLLRFENTVGLDISDEKSNNFPLNNYLSICSYYLENGIYTEKKRDYQEGYGGKINWNKTFRDSKKLIVKNNLVYLPFQVSMHQNEEVFITQCMKYILSHGYSYIYKHFSLGINYYNTQAYGYMKDIPKDKVINKLIRIKSMYFDDKTLSLISNLINYLKGMSKYNSISYFISKNFSHIWEVAALKYLNKNFTALTYNYGSSDLILDGNIYNVSFQKKVQTVENASERSDYKWKVEYDHFAKLDNSHVIVLDSKYYSNITELNYKQLAYTYFLKSQYKYVTSGLLLPTGLDYHSKLHVNRFSKDGVKVMEYYLNLKKVLNVFVKG